MRGRTWRAAAAAMGTGALFAAALLLPLPRFAVLVLDDGAQLAAATTASLACARAARRAAGVHRSTWRLFAVGTGSWAAGQALWTFSELVLGREAPFPSLADVGFLLFPVLTAVALVRWLAAGARTAARVRDVLDGAVIAGSLLLLSWCTALGSVHQAGEADLPAFLLALCYPVLDVVLATLVLLAVTRLPASRRGPLAAVAAGLAALAVADSAYVYLAASGGYATGSLTSAGWVVGFLLFAAGARCWVPPPLEAVASGAEPAGAAPAGTSLAAVLMPYLPLVAAETTVAGTVLRATTVPMVELAAGFVLLLLVLARQLHALTENRRLLLELGATRDQLRRQALHDGLTGLANRVLFADRVEHALAGDGRDVAVLFCDLDDFKDVNDSRGHAAGDAVLRAVADRLVACVRAGDTVARFGGDEFAVLLVQPADLMAVADRVVDLVGRPVVVDGAEVPVAVSVGAASVAELAPGPGGPAEHADRLLRAADVAMYAAKAAGKRRAVLAPPAAAHPVPAGPAGGPGAPVPVPARGSGGTRLRAVP